MFPEPYEHLTPLDLLPAPSVAESTLVPSNWESLL